MRMVVHRGAKRCHSRARNNPEPLNVAPASCFRSGSVTAIDKRRHPDRSHQLSPSRATTTVAENCFRGLPVNPKAAHCRLPSGDSGANTCRRYR
jgi:hypothetical protein